MTVNKILLKNEFGERVASHHFNVVKPRNLKSQGATNQKVRNILAKQICNRS